MKDKDMEQRYGLVIDSKILSHKICCIYKHKLHVANVIQLMRVHTNNGKILAGQRAIKKIIIKTKSLHQGVASSILFNDINRCS